MNKKQASKAIEIVKESIHRVDPFSLISTGSPEDEFDSEILSITSQLERCNSGRDVSHAIAYLFVHHHIY